MIKKNNSLPVLSPDFMSNTFYYKQGDKYIILNNFHKQDAFVSHVDSYYNPNYTQILHVIQGTLNLRINGVAVEVIANDLVLIKPCTTIEILDSKCVYFAEMLRAHLLFDIYEHIGVPLDVQFNMFCFHHYHLSEEDTESLRRIYMTARREAACPNYSLKEWAIRAMFAAGIAYFYEIQPKYKEVDYFPKSRQRAIFERFLDNLNQYYNQERSVQFYASKVGVTPKYLSNISMLYTGDSASSVIDNYVIFRIKFLLYDGSMNVRTISQKLNFPTQSFFGRYFKRVTGYSPREYIIRNNKQVLD